MDYMPIAFNLLFSHLKKGLAVGFFTVHFLSISMVQAVETIFWVDSQTGSAMAGYDPISFFLRGRGARGSNIYEYYWSGAVWRFQSEGNLAAFRDSPLTYAPQFGGFDPIKMSLDVSVSPDPHYSDVYNNRLYLFHSQENLDEWLGNKAKYVRSAHNSWAAKHQYGVEKNFAVKKIKKPKIQDIGMTKAEEDEKLMNQPDEVAVDDSELDDGYLYDDRLVDSMERLDAAGRQFREKRGDDQ